MKATQVVLAKYPVGIPQKDDFRFEEITLPSIKPNQILLEPLYISVDPYMRGRMIQGKSYVAPFQLNEPISGGIVAKVMDSKSSKYKKGDVVQGMLPWATQIVSSDEGLVLVSPTIPPSYYLGIVGMPGLTAYCGTNYICNPQKGETFVVSGAAGAVGTVVGQIAAIKGCRVIGIAGSDEKVQLLKSKFKYDEVINYKTEDLEEKLDLYCPNGIDCYYDNVGGIITDTVIERFNRQARMALCGQISLYNATEKQKGPRILPTLLKTSTLVKGFIVSDYADKFPEAIQELSTWVKEKKLNYTETIIEGFDNIPNAFIGLFKGVNQGKMIVKV